MSKSIKLMLVAIMVSLLNCAPPKIQLSTVAEFKDSNQMFIEAAVRKSGMAGLVKKYIPAGSRIALVSMEAPNTVDVPMVAIIEDQLIGDIVNLGATLLERDQHTVTNLLRESSEGGYTIIPAGTFQEENDASFSKPIKTQLQSAQYLISYRVLECGIMSSPAEDIKFIIREGMVRLHVRIVDAKSGAILVAGTLVGSNKDNIRASLAKELADFHYSFYSHKYPLQNEGSRKQENDGEIKDTQKKK